MEFKGAQPPEEFELNQKRGELAALETRLVDRELELTTLQQGIAAFRVEYLRIIGRRYAILDDIDAQIAEIRAARYPGDCAARQAMRTAQNRAHESSMHVEGTAAVGAADGAGRFTPSASLKAVYRTLSRKVHPDLAPTDEERLRRNEWMAKANEAYRRQQEGVLSKLLTDWETSPDAVSGEGTAIELVRAIRKIAQVNRRLDEIDETIQDLKCGQIYDLYLQYEAQSKEGANVLQSLAVIVDAKIRDAKRTLEELKRMAHA